MRISRLGGRLRIGADFFERKKALAEIVPAPRGLVDKIADLSHDKIDVARVHPAIVTFFEDPGSLDLFIRSKWHFPFSIVWLLSRWVMRLVGQFVLPAPEGRILTRVFGIDRSRDGRNDARGVIRAYADTNDVMQVVAYATWASDAAGGGGDDNKGSKTSVPPRRYMSATFPLPGGSVTGILRLDSNGEDEDGRLAIALTSRRDKECGGDGDEAGVWLSLFGLAFPVPLGEQIELWAPSMAHRPAEIDLAVFPSATIIGRHQQHVLGIRFATHHYWFRPLTTTTTTTTTTAPLTNDREAPRQT